MFIPLLKSMAFIPAATDLHPSVNMDLVSTVAHVVPVKKSSNDQPFHTFGNYQKETKSTRKENKDVG
jgi:hypothetical protein